MSFDKIYDANITAKPKEVFELSPFTTTEIQYLRGLIMADKLANDFEKQGMNAKIDRETSMHDFTEKILKALDDFEEGLGL